MQSLLYPYHEVNKRMARSLYITDSEYLQHQYVSHSHLDRPVSNESKSIKDLLGMEEAKLLENASRGSGCKKYKNYPDLKGLCGKKCDCWW